MKDICVIQSRTVQWLRFVLAATVVLLHTNMSGFVEFTPLSEQPLSSTIYYVFSWGICLIAVPTFFMVSGYFFFTNLYKWDNGVYWTKIKKRARTLLLPYILWIIIGITLPYIVSLIMHMGGGKFFIS